MCQPMCMPSCMMGPPPPPPPMFMPPPLPPPPPPLMCMPPIGPMFMPPPLVGLPPPPPPPMAFMPPPMPAMPFYSPGPCACAPGYGLCGGGICCLRKKHRASRGTFAEKLTEQQQKTANQADLLKLTRILATRPFEATQPNTTATTNQTQVTAAAA